MPPVKTGSSESTWKNGLLRFSSAAPAMWSRNSAVPSQSESRMRMPPLRRSSANETVPEFFPRGHKFTHIFFVIPWVKSRLQMYIMSHCIAKRRRRCVNGAFSSVSFFVADSVKAHLRAFRSCFPVISSVITVLEERALLKRGRAGRCGGCREIHGVS